MLNAAGTKDIIMRAGNLIGKIKNDKKDVYVYAKLTEDDGYFVRVYKNDLIWTLQQMDKDTIIECHEDNEGLYVGW